jgi:hypothetical protein
MPSEANALESAIDSMMNASNPELGNEEETAAPDGAEVSQEAGTPEASAQDAAGDANADANTRTDSADTVDGEASAGRARPQIYDQHLPSDKHGNLVAPDGRIVARAGNERAYYEAARNAMRRIRDAGAELDRADVELKAYREAALAPDKFKLSPTEAVASMEWGALYKTNPEQAIKELLADAAARGLNIPGMGLEAAALQKMLKETVAPFVKDRETATQEAEALEQGQREWNTLTEEFGWLPRHEAAFAQLLQQHPNMTPMQIALRIEREANARGIDLYNPQPQERRVNRATTPAQTTSGTLTPQAPMQEAPIAGNNTRDRIRALMKQYNFSMER